MKFKKDDKIYYQKQCNGAFDTFPGIVLQVKKRIKIEYNGLQGDVISWVTPQSLQSQK